MAALARSSILGDIERVVLLSILASPDSSSRAGNKRLLLVVLRPDLRGEAEAEVVIMAALSRLI